MNDAIQIRGNVAVIRTGEVVTLLINLDDQSQAREIRDAIAKGIEAARSSLREETWQHLSDLQAALNRSLGEAFRPKARRVRTPNPRLPSET